MNNLKFLRKNNNLTLSELSSKTNISAQMLSYYELEKANPTIATLIQLSNFYGCSVDYLLGHETKGVLHTDSFTPTQQTIIADIQNLDSDLCEKAEAYVKGLLETQSERNQVKHIYLKRN